MRLAALQNERTMASSILAELALDKITRSIIMVAGVGGAGGNTLNHMVEMGIDNVSFMACNTDAQALKESKADFKVQLGSGLGAGNKPDRGSQAAKESADDLVDLMRSEGTQMLFITAGMGGGTGTGASPILAKAAQELGILTVAIVTTPYYAEGPIRNKQAESGIEELRHYTDSLMVINNDNIAMIHGDLPYDEGFRKADDILGTTIKGIVGIITRHGTVNVDFADVNTVMKESGKAFVGAGTAEGAGRAEEAIEASVASLLNFRDITGAQNILLNMCYGDKPMTQNETRTILTNIQRRTGGTANIIWGATRRAELGKKLELTIIATGFPGEGADSIYVPPSNGGEEGGETGSGKSSVAEGEDKKSFWDKMTEILNIIVPTEKEGDDCEI